MQDMYGRRRTNQSLKVLLQEVAEQLPDSEYSDSDRSSLVALAMFLFVAAMAVSFVLGVTVGVTYL